jgi:hypothetical protein
MRTFDTVETTLGRRRNKAVKICHLGVSSHFPLVLEERLVAALSVTEFTFALDDEPEKAAKAPEN